MLKHQLQESFELKIKSPGTIEDEHYKKKSY